MPIAKSSKVDIIDIMPSPSKKAECYQPPYPSILAYFPKRITFSVFNGLALSVKHHFQQLLKTFTPKAEDDIIKYLRESCNNIWDLIILPSRYLGLRNNVKAYLNEVDQCLKLKAQLENCTPTVEVLRKQAALLENSNKHLLK